MTKEEAMKIANNYSQKYYPNCDIVWYAGEIDGFHFVWIKDTTMPRYTGFGSAISISPKGDISKITSNAEIHEISKSAYELNDGYNFFNH